MEFTYTHPLINQGAGRIKSDPINEERIRKVLDNFKTYHSKNGGKFNHDFPITQEAVKTSKIVFPLVGTGLGILGSFAFVHGNSKYIGKCFTLLMLYGGWWLHRRYEMSYNSSQYFWNYPEYPRDIQKMIDNNDARYAYRWLAENYMENQL